MTTRGEINSNFYQIVNVDGNGAPTSVKPEYLPNVGNANYATNAGHANVADSANSVSVANVVGIGNIATTNYSGNGSQTLLGNGTWGALPNTANANYANFAGTAFSVSVANVSGIGNIAVVNLTGSNSNVLYGNGVFAPGGGSGANANYANFAGNVVNSAQPNITSVGNLTSLYVEGNIQSNAAVYVGYTANATGLTNPTIIAKASGATYVQAAVVNGSPDGSADYVTYGDNGSDSGAWADMGFTGSNFSDPTYTITGINDGYFFVQGDDTSTNGGNLVIATGPQGSTKDIVFATGGFQTIDEKMRFIHAESQFYIEPTTAATDTTTGALRVGGGVGIAGDVYAGNAVSANFFLGDGGLLSNITISGNVSNANFAAYSNVAYLLSDPVNSNVANMASMDQYGQLYTIDLLTNGNIGVQGATGLTFSDDNGRIQWTQANYSGATISSQFGQVELITGEPTAGTPLSGRSTLHPDYLQVDFSNTANSDFKTWSFDRSNLTFPDTTVQQTAWTGNVPVANVTGIGNIATINLSGNGSQLLAGNGAWVAAPSTANANYANFAGTVITSSQPNITSVGTLTSLSVTGNITSGNASLGNLVAGNYFSGDGSLLTSITGANVTGIVGNATHANVADLANSVAAANIIGTVNLANFATVANSVAGANVSGAVTYATTANSVAGANVSGQVANSLVAGTVYTAAQPNITSVGTLSSLSVTGNITSGNATLGNLVTGNYFSGNGSLLTGITATTGNANYANYAGNAFSVTGSNVSGPVAFATVANSVAGSNVSGQVAFAAVANSVAGSNVSGQVANSLIAGTVYTAAQPNITSVGSLTSLTVTGNITSGNINGGNLILGNYHSGNGSLLTSLTGANVTGTVANATYAVSAGTATTATTAGTVTTNAQPNINSVGTLTSLGVTGNITSGNINGGNLVTGNFFTGNGSLLTSITGANVTGTVANATYALTTGSAGTATTAVTVTGNAQPNISSLGTLTSTFFVTTPNTSATAAQLTPVWGNASVNYTTLIVDGVDAGNVNNTNSLLLDFRKNGVSQANVTPTGNIRAKFFIGNGSQLTGVTSTATPAGSNTYIQFNDGGVTGANSQFTYDKTTNTLTVGNVNGTVSTAVTVTGNSQPNITDLGTLTYLSVSNTVAAAGAVASFAIASGSNANAGIVSIAAPGGLALGSNANLLSVYTNNAASNANALFARFHVNGTNKFTVNLNGNVTGNYFIGNGSALTGITATATPAGANTQVQFNDNGSLGASANFAFDKTSNTLTVTNIIANGSGLTSLTGANVTGQVPFAAVANSVAGANVSGQVSFAAVANSVAGANVSGAVTYATTANSVAVANVSGIGNIATVNLDGNLSNILYGNGVFAAAPSVGNVANANYANFAGNAFSVTGSNVSGPVAFATTANSVAGANVSGEVAFAAVANSVAGANVSGTVANATYAVTSGSATTAGTVTTAAQPNITSLGTLTSLTATGNITGDYFIGNGSALTGITSTATPGGANTQIQFNNNGSMGGISTVTWNGSNISLGAVTTVKITGGSTGQVIQTDGTGNLSFVNQSGGGGASSGFENVFLMMGA